MSRALCCAMLKLESCRTMVSLPGLLLVEFEVRTRSYCVELHAVLTSPFTSTLPVCTSMSESKLQAFI